MIAWLSGEFVLEPTPISALAGNHWMLFWDISQICFSHGVGQIDKIWPGNFPDQIGKYDGAGLGNRIAQGVHS